MLRRLLNIASVVCLVLCVALVGLWVRSYWWADDFVSPNMSSCEVVGGSLVGRLLVGVISGGAEPPAFRHTPVTNYATELANLDRNWTTFAGFGFVKDAVTGVGAYAVMFPYWFAIVIMAAFCFAAKRHVRYSFSLRTLFIATTFLAVVLGMSAWLVRAWIGK